MSEVNIPSSSQSKKKFNLLSIILFLIWISITIFGISIIYLLLRMGNGYFIFLLLFWNAFSYVGYILMYYPTNSIVDTLFYFIDSRKWEGNPEFAKDLAAQILESLAVGIISILVFGSTGLFINVIVEVLSITGILLIFITVINVFITILEFIFDKEKYE